MFIIIVDTRIQTNIFFRSLSLSERISIACQITIYCIYRTSSCDSILFFISYTELID